MFHNLLHGVRKGRKVGANPWGGATLEWKVPSPPPEHQFPVIPEVTGGPYVYDEGEVHDE